MSDAVDAPLHYCEENIRKILYITKLEAETNTME
jgi:hypothetical protein